jgi:5-methylcytosine-specific restriction endonuclease McrA
MGKKLPHTPNSRIKSTLHQLFLRSRERAAVLKRDNYTCTICHRKQSMAKGKEFKVQCHHIYGVIWAEMIEYIRERLLVNPDDMVTVCRKCHADIHKKDE